MVYPIFEYKWKYWDKKKFIHLFVPSDLPLRSYLAQRTANVFSANKFIWSGWVGAVTSWEPIISIAGVN